MKIKILFKSFIPLLKMYYKFSNRKKIQILSLIPIFISQSFLELFSIGAIIPFVTSIIDPDSTFQYLLDYPFILNFLSINESSDLVYPFFLIFIVLIMISASFKLLTVYLILRITYTAGSELAEIIFKNNIYQYYSFYLKKKSNELITLVHSKSSRAISSMIAAMQIINNLILLFIVFIGFVVVYPFFTIISFSVLGGAYTIVMIAFKGILNNKSKIIFSSENILVGAIRDAFQQIKEIIINKNHKYFINKFSTNIRSLNSSMVITNFIANSPKIIIESIGLVVLSIVAFRLVTNGNNFLDILPFFAVLGLAAQRLLPLFQQLYYSIAHIESDYATLLEIANNSYLISKEKEFYSYKNIFKGFKSIEFKNVNFDYDDKNIINDLNVKIKSGSKIGIVGHTGSGKSTFIDLFLGLNFPKTGGIFIDNIKLTYENVNDWQKNISHVSQIFTLSDKSIEENIFFGSEEEKINKNKIDELIEKLELTNLIKTFKNSTNFNVGESGVLISGGERQKIALARALYKKFNILVLDEATSSLDNKNEEKIMNEIYNLKNKTILIIAHRLSSIKKCDEILEFEDGNIINRGTYEYLFKNSTTFREIAKDLK